MTFFGVLKAVTKPVVWLGKYFVHGLSIVGLSMHGRPYQRSGADPVIPDPDPIPAATTTPARNLTPDELLWQAELE